MSLQIPVFRLARCVSAFPALLLTISAVLFVSGSSLIRAQQKPTQVKLDVPTIPQAFQAEVEYVMGNFIEHKKIYYDRGKWRVETLIPGIPGTKAKPFTKIELYDGDRPPVVWEYYPHAQTAVATFETYRYTLSEEARRFGEAQTRKKYNIAKTLPGRRTIVANMMPPNAHPCILTRHDLESIARPTGRKAKIVGHTCEEILAEWKLANGAKAVSRAWVEPRSGLVLIKEDGAVQSARSAAPNFANLLRFKELKFVSKFSPSLFELPPGTTVVTPRSLAYVPLPRGVKRKPMQGRASECGLGYPTQVSKSAGRK